MPLSWALEVVSRCLSNNRDKPVSFLLTPLLKVFCAWMAGARFDLVFEGITDGWQEIKEKLLGYPPADPALVRAAKAVTSSIVSATKAVKSEL